MGVSVEGVSERSDGRIATWGMACSKGEWHRQGSQRTHVVFSPQLLQLLQPSDVNPSSSSSWGTSRQLAQAGASLCITSIPTYVNLCIQFYIHELMYIVGSVSLENPNTLIGVLRIPFSLHPSRSRVDLKHSWYNTYSLCPLQPTSPTPQSLCTHYSTPLYEFICGGLARFHSCFLCSAYFLSSPTFPKLSQLTGLPRSFLKAEQSPVVQGSQSSVTICLLIKTYDTIIYWVIASNPFLTFFSLGHWPYSAL